MSRIPRAIVVAIDAGHGGCLDWGVPDPSRRGVELAEKTLTLGIAQRLRDRLEADGIGVVMIRDGDVALAGDDYPALGCEGPPWRDVDGDGNSGFEESGRIRTRDELQARTRPRQPRRRRCASEHPHQLADRGRTGDRGRLQPTFYDDETPWGPGASASLAAAIQRGTVAAIDPLTTYTRQDRGTEAVAYYAISRAWADGDTCEREGDTDCKHPPWAAMPVVLYEVGSITLRAEHDLLASEAGQQTVAAGLFDGLASFTSASARSRDASASPTAAVGRSAAGCGRRPAVLGAGRHRRTARLADDEHRHRARGRRARARGRLGGIGPAVPRAAARGSPADRARGPRAGSRRIGRHRSDCPRMAGGAAAWHGSRYRRSCIPGGHGVAPRTSALQRNALKRCAPHRTR